MIIKSEWRRLGWPWLGEEEETERPRVAWGMYPGPGALSLVRAVRGKAVSFPGISRQVIGAPVLKGRLYLISLAPKCSCGIKICPVGALGRVIKSSESLM